MSIQNYTFHIMESAGAGTKTYYIPFDRPVDIEAVTLVGPVIGANAADFITLQVYGNDGATVLCSRNTDSGGTGTDIVEGVSEDLVMANADKASFSDSQSLKITNQQSGSGKVVNLTLNFKVRDARKFS